ncbi:MAG: hypothetical protein KA419_16345 [Acidobacteria bacterium]|nr:hypothetical protein [Acidobacteriota bacterium]
MNFTVAAGNPDLIVDSFTINPASPTPTTEITFTGVVKNAGNAPAPPSKAQFSVSTQLFDVPQLAPGAKHPVVLKMKLDKAQNYGPTFTVDKASNVSESSETNNSKQIHFTVTAANPDLVVESFTISPSSPTTATEITFTGVVKNAGNAPAPASKAHFSVATKYFDVPQLAPGARYTVIHKMKLDRAQKYGPTFSVDRMRDVAESSESNNEKQIFFVVTQAK